jgi:hypothetical protein
MPQINPKQILARDILWFMQSSMTIALMRVKRIYHAATTGYKDFAPELRNTRTSLPAEIKNGREAPGGNFTSR